MSAARASRGAVLLAGGLAVLYTLLISSADAITKHVAEGFAAPQLYSLAALVVLGLSLGADRLRATPQGLRTRCPGQMALRSCFTVLAALGYFQAFRLLPFADVFLFIGLMPLMAGVLSGPVLAEKVSRRSWLALGAGAAGMVLIFPQGLHAVAPGHLFAFGGALSGTLSILLARRIGKVEQNALTLVFYPNLALLVSMGAALPFVFRPMGGADLVWVLGYGAVLFAARLTLVLALRHMAAYAVAPVMNLQFVWMVGLGALVFGEMPQAHVYLGVAVVVASGLYLLREQMGPAPFRRPSLRAA